MDSNGLLPCFRHYNARMNRTAIIIIENTLAILRGRSREFVIRPFNSGVSAKEPAPLLLIKGHFASKIVGAEDETRRDSVQDRSRRFLDTN